MSKLEKLIRRLKQEPKDFSWEELVSLLRGLGYEEQVGGKTGGSRRRFVKDNFEPIILHKPHPKKILKGYAIKDVLEKLKNDGLI